MTNKGSTKKSAPSQEQRARRLQQILFGGLALIMILSMLISLVAR